MMFGAPANQQMQQQFQQQDSLRGGQANDVILGAAPDQSMQQKLCQQQEPRFGSQAKGTSFHTTTTKGTS